MVELLVQYDWAAFKPLKESAIKKVVKQVDRPIWDSNIQIMCAQTIIGI